MADAAVAAYRRQGLASGDLARRQTDQAAA